MKLRYHLALILLIPVLMFTVLVATQTRVTVPLLGRDYVLRFPLEWLQGEASLPKISGPDGDQFPLLVIDAGHGGFDYGATGAGYREKDIVLGLAQALEQRLIEAGDIRVAMTRDDDTFLPLNDRLKLARELGADLFLSIHADSAGEQREVAGASIYTLSQRASSVEAARFAARENDVDTVNGVKLSDHNEEVNNILLDLAQRQMQEQSREFARLIENSGEGRILFHPQTQRSASLVVLRSPDVPSVLFESGFVTNVEDAARLTSENGRRNFAEAMASAVRAYFARVAGENPGGAN